MADNPVLVGLTFNVAVLLALALLTGLAPRSLGQGDSLRSRLLMGLLVAAFGMAVMLVPVELADGLLFDVRSVVLSLSGLFYGLVPTAIGMAATGVLRWLQGGVAAPYGIALILASGAVGLAWRRWRGPSLQRLGPLELYGFGLLVHVIMIAIIASLPAPLARVGLQQVAVPALLIYPLATVVVGRLLVMRLASEARQAERMQREVDMRREAERNERRLSAALERLELFFDHAPASLAMFDRDLRYTAVSQRYIDDFDLQGRDLIGRHHYDVSPEIPEKFREAHRRALAGEIVRSGDEDWFERTDGTKMWTRWEVRPWFDDEGAIGGMILFTEDITSSVESRQQVQKLSRAVEQSAESIVITNVDAEIEFVNDAFVAATGYARDEVMGKNPRILNAGRTPSETYREMWATLTEGRDWRGEFVNRRKDGSTYAELATISPVRGNTGEVTHYVAVKEDVTEQRRIERELDAYRTDLERLVEERTHDLAEARERAEVASHAKSAFLASMSHEIRTPLNAIVGLTHLLLRDDPTDQQRDRLGRVDRSAEHLLSIVNDVLDVAKIEAGKMVLDERDFHLSAVLDHVRSMIAPSAEAKGVVVTIDRDHVPMWLFGDAVRLRQALLNLAGNAVKFTERGTIHLRSELFEESDDGLRVRFEVEDSGVGIAPGLLPTLFEDFEQGDVLSKRKGGGTGLGLAITRRIAELMGGEVGVDSAPGVGTRVWFSCSLQRGHGVMPGRTDPLAPSVEQQADGERFAGRKVLLAEDNPINLEVATDLLRGFGLDVDVAENGREAIERARVTAYDLVLMDVQMPEMNGLEATREIRSGAINRQVPILAITANAFEDDRKACYAAGMNDFVAKPVDPPRLRSTLAAWLSRPRPGSVGAGATAGRASPAPSAAAPPSEDAARTPPYPRARSARHRAWACSGLDADAGVAALDGDEARYMNLLRRFATAHAEDAHQLRRDLSAGEVDSARRRVHALQGVAGTLGAWRLSKAASELEASLASGAPVDATVLATVGTELDELVRCVGPFPAPRSEPEAGEGLAVPEIVSRLRALIEVDDPDTLDWHAAHQGALQRAYGAEADELAEAVEAYDFERARAVLDQIGSHRAPDSG